MLSDERTQVITQIHDSPSMAVLVVTGGGARTLAELTAVPGASRTILEALIPYCDASLTEFLQAMPEQAVASDTAKALATRAYERAAVLKPREGVPVIGVACTATLATDRPKKGPHRMHVAVCGAESTKIYSLTLTKGARTREAEEQVAGELVLVAMAEACGISTGIAIDLLSDEEILCVERLAHRGER